MIQVFLNIRRVVLISRKHFFISTLNGIVSHMLAQRDQVSVSMDEVARWTNAFMDTQTEE